MNISSAAPSLHLEYNPNDVPATEPASLSRNERFSASYINTTEPGQSSHDTIVIIITSVALGIIFLIALSCGIYNACKKKNGGPNEATHLKKRRGSIDQGDYDDGF